MTEPTPAPPTRRTRLRQWYDHVFLPLYNTWAPAVLSVCILFSGFAMVSTYLQQRTQDRVTATLLRCFDTYANNVSTSNKAVRDATVAKDDATADRDDALNAEGVAFLSFVRALQAGRVDGPEDIKPLADALADRAEAGQRLDKAQRRLDRVRRLNPIPEPPSVFCKLPD